MSEKHTNQERITGFLSWTSVNMNLWCIPIQRGKQTVLNEHSILQNPHTFTMVLLCFIKVWKPSHRSFIPNSNATNANANNSSVAWIWQAQKYTILSVCVQVRSLIHIIEIHKHTKKKLQRHKHCLDGNCFWWGRKVCSTFTGTRLWFSCRPNPECLFFFQNPRKNPPPN